MATNRRRFRNKKTRRNRRTRRNKTKKIKGGEGGITMEITDIFAFEDNRGNYYYSTPVGDNINWLCVETEKGTSKVVSVGLKGEIINNDDQKKRRKMRANN